jgi:molybdopterin converting factor small subunit
MPSVTFTRHLHRFFPVLEAGPLSVEGKTVADVLRAVEAEVPGLTDYIVDERFTLRMHVNIFIGNEMIVDRRGLSDVVPEGATVHVLQALSGG